MDNSLPGFRFYPTEETLLSFYLHNKLNDLRPEIACAIFDVNVFSLEPWQLQLVSEELCVQDKEQWLFFCPQLETSAAGSWPCRMTTSGFWIRTGHQATIYSSTNCRLGIRKMWVFYNGRDQRCQRTEWVINQYQLYEATAVTTTAATSSATTTEPDRVLMTREEFTLCRLQIESDRPRTYVNHLQIGPSSLGSFDPQPQRTKIRRI